MNEMEQDLGKENKLKFGLIRPDNPSVHDSLSLQQTFWQDVLYSLPLYRNVLRPGYDEQIVLSDLESFQFCQN